MSVIISTECGSCESLLALNLDTLVVAALRGEQSLRGRATLTGDDLAWNCPRCGQPDGGSMDDVAMRMLA